MIKFKSIKKLSPQGLFNLYQAVGWTSGVKNKKKHAILLSKVYSNSDLVFSAWHKNELVGVVRAITDKYAHGLMYGLVVRSEFQRQGIATKLISLCLKKYPKIQWSFEAEDPKFKLFKKIGFVKSKNAYLTKGSSPI